MKTKQAFILSAAILFGIAVSHAEDTNSGLAANIAGYANNTNVIWGASTNGVRAGQEIIGLDRWGKNSYPPAPLSRIFFQNVGASNATYRVRYKAELRGPSGSPVKLKSEQTILMHSRRSPTGLRSQETSQIGSFSIPDVFRVSTNGSHKLIVLVEAAPNRLHGPLTYFSLPPVTNTVEILANSFAGNATNASPIK